MTTGLTEAKRIVIKIGSALLIDPVTGRLDTPWLRALAQDIADLKKDGKEILIVSSGAIALGRAKLGLKPDTLKLEESQAAAAAGQIDLAHAWQDAIQPFGYEIAQILLTLSDTEERRRYLNARNTIDTLLSVGAVPVINENDTVATSEIRYGDNDRLAARVAAMVSADCLILLSDIDGLYSEDPKNNPDAGFIEHVDRIDDAVMAMAGKVPEKTANNVGSGGMVTKLDAARITTDAGCHMVIAKGTDTNPLRRIQNGARSTWFSAINSPRAARKQWIAGSLKPQGIITVDHGAAKALHSGKSLLAAGMTGISGQFERGDAISVCDPNGQEIARGLSAYSSGDATLIAGQRSDQIENILGYRGRSEVIHRDDLVVLSEGART